MQALQPQCSQDHIGLGYSPFARHYLGNHYCFLFLWVLRCFSSPGLLPRAYVFSPRMTLRKCRVAPFGNPRIQARLQLPVAYRSLSRPSSPARAKASTMRPFLLIPLRFYTSQVRENSRWRSSLRSFYARMKAILASIISARCSFWRISSCQRTWITSDPSGVSRIRTGDPRYAKPMLYHLSYNPSHLRAVRPAGWGWEELNLRPHAYQACALTT